MTVRCTALLLLLLLPSCGGGGGGPAPTQERGAAATWEVDRSAPPTAVSTVVPVLVTRLGCAGGETGRVLAPQVQERADEVVVTFDVLALPEGGYTCPGNAPVGSTLTLSQPLGERRLVDGACLSGEAAGTGACPGAQRWPVSR